MINYNPESIFTSKAQTIVCPVNCGVSFNGLALEAAKLYPGFEDHHKERCRAGEVAIGKPYLYVAEDGTRILAFPTRKRLERPTTIPFIEVGFKYLAANYIHFNITSLAMPLLGTGADGLTPIQVLPPLYYYFGALKLPVTVHTTLI